MVLIVYFLGLRRGLNSLFRVYFVAFEMRRRNSVRINSPYGEELRNFGGCKSDVMSLFEDERSASHDIEPCELLVRG